jgi:hypothetical protein
LSAPVLSRLFFALGKQATSCPATILRAARRQTGGVHSCPQSPPIRPSFVPETPRPNPQSQSLSRGYGSILPTSLIYIVLSTRGCTPWRPEAVMSTTRRVNKSFHWVFTGRRERTGPCKRDTALPATSPYRRAIRFHGQAKNKAVKKKRKLFPRTLANVPSFTCVTTYHPRPGTGILTRFPFDRRRHPKKTQHSDRILLSLRIDSPMSNCCSHGTFLHISLQSSHLNNCYCYQDLH